MPKAFAATNCILLFCISGKMIVSDLEAKIEKAKIEGAVPFMVSATAGTTVLGAFDPLNPIADICSKHGIWFHVDVIFFFVLSMLYTQHFLSARIS